MKILLVFLILSIFLLSGCSPYIYNPNNFVLPDDAEFLALIQELDTPRKTCQYMADNFIYGDNLILLTPYQLLLIKIGNCDDFSFWAIFFPYYHGYEIYQILIEFPLDDYHMIGVFKEGDYYNISENTLYIECFCQSFRGIMNSYLYHGWVSYEVYDYSNNLIEKVQR